MITYVQGDLLETDAEIIAHGCNCVGGFGSGVAGQIAKKYPVAKYEYLRKHKDTGWQLGEVQAVLIKATPPKWVVNCATQNEYMPRGVCHADYEAIRKCMSTIKETAKGLGYSIAIPKLGAGLAGGDWNIIEKILEEVFSDYEVFVYYL